MVCTLHRASDQDIDRLIAHPDELPAFLDPADQPRLEVEVVRPKGLLGFLLRLTPITIEQVKPQNDLRDDELLADLQPSDDELDLDKAWHGLHFLLTGSAWEGHEPGCFLVRGGEEIGDEDYGYGPVRAFRSQQTQEIASFLGALSRAELTRRFDPGRMTQLQIYPEVIWTRRADDDDPLEYVLLAFDELQPFVMRTAAEGLGLLVSLT
jgi:hypothetical protein